LVKYGVEPMSSLIAIGLVVALLAFIAWRIAAERVVFVLRVDAGRVVSAKGRLPQSLLADLQDVLAASNASGRVVAVRAGERARLELRGRFPAEVGQRLRNVVGRSPLAKIMNAPRR
jgi:hypothetical protein